VLAPDDLDLSTRKWCGQLLMVGWGATGLVSWSLMAFSARGTFSNESGISTIFSSGPKGQKWAQPVI